MSGSSRPRRDDRWSRLSPTRPAAQKGAEQDQQLPARALSARGCRAHHPPCRHRRFQDSSSSALCSLSSFSSLSTLMRVLIRHFGIAGCRGLRLRLTLGIGLMTLPRPVTFDLDLQGHAQNGADQDDDRQHGDVFESRRHDHGADDVARHQEFQAEHDRAAEVLPEAPDANRLCGRSASGEPPCSDQDTPSNDQNASSVERQPYHSITSRKVFMASCAQELFRPRWPSFCPIPVLLCGLVAYASAKTFRRQALTRM